MHSNVVIAWSCIKAHNILLKVVLSLTLNLLKDHIILNLRSDTHNSVRHWYLFVSYFDILKVKCDCVRVLRVLEEEHFQEESFPTFQGIALKARDMHDSFLRVFLDVVFLFMGQHFGRDNEILLTVQGYSDMVLLIVDDYRHIVDYIS